MRPWPQQPVIYEINTWVWLTELGRKHGSKISLGNIPAAEWDSLAALGVDGIWFMGVWERSPAGRAISASSPDLIAEYHRTLPDFVGNDVSGSGYCIHNYVVDSYLGGPEGLALAREDLSKRGLSLLLDFVPNHLAPDHPWTISHPEYFIRGTKEDLARDPVTFFRAGDAVLAHGRDPYFAPWFDTAQLNAFSPGLRAAALHTVDAIANQCDGVRCDMAMLMINRIFAKTWGARAGDMPGTEYWRDLMGEIKARHPGFTFIAEAYWDLESDLIEQGFNYCYDKRLYDRFVHEDAASVRAHLGADLSYQKHLIRFLENHDEPRAAAVLAPNRQRAAAVALMTLPGAKLLHDGQFEGRKAKLPVHLSRRPDEPVDSDLLKFYRQLLATVKDCDLRKGKWTLHPLYGWPDNASCRNLLSWSWQNANQKQVIVVNFSDMASQGLVQIPLPELRGQQWRLDDLLNRKSFFPRDGGEIADHGLYVDLAPWAYHWFAMRAI